MSWLTLNKHVYLLRFFSSLEQKHKRWLRNHFYRSCLLLMLILVHTVIFSKNYEMALWTVCIYILLSLQTILGASFLKESMFLKLEWYSSWGNWFLKPVFIFFSCFLFLNSIKNKRNSQISLEFITSNQDNSIEYRLYFYSSIKNVLYHLNIYRCAFKKFSYLSKNIFTC